MPFFLADKEQIMKVVEDWMCAKRAHLYSTKHEDVEVRLLSWMKDVLSRNIPVSGEMLNEKALQLAKSFGLNDFKASDGWLTRFKSRHAVCWKRIQGEAGNIDLDVLNEWQRTGLDLSLEQFSPDDVYNADELGLFWQLLPNKTLTLFSNKALFKK